MNRYPLQLGMRKATFRFDHTFEQQGLNRLPKLDLRDKVVQQ